MDDSIRCTDCYEENAASAERCRRCGRSLDEVRQRRQVRFEVQHADAPDVMSDRNRPRVPGDNGKQSRVW